jgi:hypothetical protein
VQLFDVTWIFDRLTDPQKHKMMVCLTFERGWFLRINTRNNFRPCVPITRHAHPFLKHDSHVECSLLEIDEFEIEEALTQSGIIGRVDLAAKADICMHLLKAPYISTADKRELARLLG